MYLAMVGLGRMGMNMAKRLARGGHQVAAYNRTYAKAEAFANEESGGTPVERLEDLLEVLAPPRVVWLMLPADTVDGYVDQLAELLEPGDVVVEGGNSYYKDDMKRAPRLDAKGIAYMDAGVSGGIWGLSEGYCIMAGGQPETFAKVEPAIKTLAPPEGYLHTGPVGSGHYVKMIHNGIEYGMMQAYAEGFEIMNNGPFSEHHDFAKICHLWMRGSVVRSWLLELLENAFDDDARLDSLAGYVDDSGEGRWTVMESVETATFAPVMALALMDRFRSRRSETFGDKVLAALRNQFGGHAVKTAGD
ncbi:MAG: decarboxylating 6-phosphogluconate dehydrogenase [Desulfarculaceae bacterium]|nr:decarboxylating 6-phosphogluconate dehydrogenase [Desulfarculaceae bacterium]MCF8118241.1 decarboxylating 6-phosphogluconate dehydrogenase [Desulfarculaceae bacterium]